VSGRCIHCRERFAICAVTYEVDGGELCESCDETFPVPFRPSLGGAVAYLGARSALPLAVRMASPTWPEVDRRKHPRAAATPEHMTRRRTYSCLAIARRHPRIFAALSASVGRLVPVPNSASQSYHWPQVGRHPGSAE
jgi:hypothetical protein